MSIHISYKESGQADKTHVPLFSADEVRDVLFPACAQMDLNLWIIVFNSGLFFEDDNDLLFLFVDQANKLREYLNATFEYKEAVESIIYRLNRLQIILGRVAECRIKDLYVG